LDLFYYGWSCLIFFLFDGTIRNIIVRHEIIATGENNKAKYMGRLRRELGDLRSDYSKNYYSTRDFKKLEKKLMKDIKRAAKSKVK